MDWADEIAVNYIEINYVDRPKRMDLAAALRKAKAKADGEASGERKGRASGMREAAELMNKPEVIWSVGDESWGSGNKNFLVGCFRGLGSKIHPPKSIQNWAGEEFSRILLNSIRASGIARKVTPQKD